MSNYRKKFTDEIRGGCRGHVDFKWESIKNDKERENYLGQSLHNNPQWWSERFTKKSIDAERYREKYSTQIRQSELESVKAREQQLMEEALGLRPKSTARAYNPRALSKYDILEVTRPGAITEGESGAALSGAGGSRGVAQSSNPDRVPGIGYGELWRPGRNQVAPTRLEEEKGSAENGGVVAGVGSKRENGKSFDETLKSEFVKVDQGIKNYDNDYGISSGWSDDENGENGENDENDGGEWKEAPKKIDLKNLTEVLGSGENGGLKRKVVSDDGNGKDECGDEPAKKERKRSHSRQRHHHHSHSHHRHHSHNHKEKSEKSEKEREHSHHRHHHHHH